MLGLECPPGKPPRQRGSGAHIREVCDTARIRHKVRNGDARPRLKSRCDGVALHDLRAP